MELSEWLPICLLTMLINLQLLCQPVNANGRDYIGLKKIFQTGT